MIKFTFPSYWLTRFTQIPIRFSKYNLLRWLTRFTQMPVQLSRGCPQGVGVTYLGCYAVQTFDIPKYAPKQTIAVAHRNPFCQPNKSTFVPQDMVAVSLRVTQINSDHLRVTQINSDYW